MSKGLRVSLITTAVVVAAAALLLVGINLGQARFYAPGIFGSVPTSGFAPWFGSFAGGMMGPGVTGNYGMMDGYGMMSPGMMGGYGMTGMMGTGMMGGYGIMGHGAAGGHGMMGQGMMGSYGAGQLFGVEPLSVEQATAAVENYLEAADADGLSIGEVMIFDNHAYVQVVEEESEASAFELLVDPVTLSVYPEHGPNMMWNLKYGMMGGMMGRGGWTGSMQDMMRSRVGDLDPSDQPIDPEQAVQIAQDYLDTNLAGAQAEQSADTFYGYYTIHILRDGETVGMLSVNASTGQVWVHTWHGDLIETSDHHD